MNSNWNMVGATACTSNEAFQLSVFMLHMEHVMPLYKLDHWILIFADEVEKNWSRKRTSKHYFFHIRKFIIFILTVFFTNRFKFNLLSWTMVEVHSCVLCVQIMWRYTQLAADLNLSHQPDFFSSHWQSSHTSLISLLNIFWSQNCFRRFIHWDCSDLLVMLVWLVFKHPNMISVSAKEA